MCKMLAWFTLINFLKCYVFLEASKIKFIFDHFKTHPNLFSPFYSINVLWPNVQQLILPGTFEVCWMFDIFYWTICICIHVLLHVLYSIWIQYRFAAKHLLVHPMPWLWLWICHVTHLNGGMGDKYGSTDKAWVADPDPTLLEMRIWLIRLSLSASDLKFFFYNM